MSRRALGSEHASQFSTNQSIVAEFGGALCLQATKRLTKFQVKKGFIAPQGCYQDQLVLFIAHMHDEFHVSNVLIVLLYMWRLNSQGYWVKQKQAYKLAMSDSQNYTRQLGKHIHVVHHICITFAQLACCCRLISQTLNRIRLRKHYSSLLLVFTRRFWLFYLSHMGHRDYSYERAKSFLCQWKEDVSLWVEKSTFDVGELGKEIGCLS